MKTKYWTVWGAYSVCSVHKSREAAREAVKECEKFGGSKHRIYRVTRIKRKR